MVSKYAVFDRARLRLKPLAERVNDLDAAHWLALDEIAEPYADPQLPAVAERIVRARERGAARILMMGAHLLRAGVNRQIIDLIERGFLDHIAMNGAGVIHDYELARIGATTESVARYIATGEFGLWRETGELNDWIVEAASENLGLGENIGRRIDSSTFPHRDLSVFAAATKSARTSFFPGCMWTKSGTLGFVGCLQNSLLRESGCICLVAKSSPPGTPSQRCTALDGFGIAMLMPSGGIARIYRRRNTSPI